ncbi:DUF6531 domain-containing protein [Nocardioides sp.]|uniref:DUF6531 domain-containing protein n=1 Tax=Nocardioides sp. TaxID=35761 RepID=UPI002CFC589E|nr:DUF6531 domain-containing protein [Nocardioides sp.]HXH77560.1 DUF6531 domain-containing protein [Nocardioides sp.]
MSFRSFVSARSWSLPLLAALIAGLVPAVVSGPGVAALPAGGTVITSSITTDQVWTPAGSPYIINGLAFVESGATLTIEPGTVVKFGTTNPDWAGAPRLSVYHGRVVARGTAANPIVFTSLWDDSVGGDTDGGGRAPLPGDWTGVNISQPNVGASLAMAPSVFTNTSFRYGGHHARGGCAYGSELAVDRLGQLRVSKSEFLYSFGAGVGSEPLEPGVGSLSVSNVLVSQSSCGFYPRGGTYKNNVVDSSVVRAFWSIHPSRVVMSGNWFAPLGDVNGPGSNSLDRDNFNFYNNAIPSGISAAGDQSPVDLSGNWWGADPSKPYSCHVDGDNEVPALGLNGATPASGCPTLMHTAYFTKVLPFAPPPPVPQAGIGADPLAPSAVPFEQLLGGLGGSEYAYPAQGSMADPVATATGAYVEERLDAAVPAPGLGLTAARTYNSADPSVGWLGKGWHFGYEAWLDISGDASVVVLHAEDGQQVRYDRQPDGTYRGGAGVTAKLTREGDVWVIGTRAQLKRTFGSNGRLRSITDANNNTVSLTYNTAGHLATATSAGRTLTFTNDTAGRITKVALQDGRYVGYAYTNGLLTSVRDLAGRTTTYGYDTQGRLTTKTNASSVQVMRLAYDPTSGRVSEQFDALNQRTVFGWDAVTGTATMTDPRGKVWTDRYTGGLLVARTAPDGATTTYTYDAKLQLVETEGPRGGVNEFTYNDAGDLISTTTPTGTVTTVYDQRHRPIESVNARGTRVEYKYDAADNLTRIIRPEPGNPTGTLEESFTYSTRGQLLTSTDARGKIVTNTYTAAGDLASTTSPTGAKSTFAYDTTGRLLSNVEPRGNVTGADPLLFTTKYTYAADDQPLTVTDALGRRTSFTYDTLGRRKTVVDAKTRTTTYTYDTLDRVTAVKGPHTAVPAATFGYDANSNLIKETDTAGRVTSYEYDSVNRMVKGTTPLGVYTYAYDKSGNMTKATDPTLASTSMVYDNADRLISLDYPSGSDVSYRYDAHGNRISMTDGAGTVSYAYDKLDRLLSVTRGSSVFRFGYDRVGALTKMTYPDGTVYDYAYDDAQRLDTVTKAGTALADYDYDIAGLPSRLTRGNNTTAAYTHDRAGQLTRIQDTAPGGASLLDETYAYDATGNLTGITGPKGQRTFTYDVLDRLTAACYNTASCTKATDYVKWTYDAANNRTSEVRPAGTTNYQYAATTGLLTSTTGRGASTFAYDPLGQLKTKTVTGGATTAYTYLPSGRVATEAVTGGATTTHTYDGDGRRLTSATGGTTTAFGWNPASYQLATESTGGSVVRRYSYGLGAIGLERPGQAGSDFFHLDRMASVRTVTNQAAATQWNNEWEPYGVPRTTTKVDPAAGVNPMGWTGQYADPSGQVHLRARQYDPTLGRFMAPDQAAAMSYSGTGTYANANPLAYTDPTGLWPSWNDVVNVATVVAPVAGVIAPFTGPLAPVVGGVALAAGAITAIDAAYGAYQVCSGNEKGSCAGEIAIGALGIVASRAGASVLRSGVTRLRSGARSCSFGGSTVVLMANGTRKPIEDVEVGDWVIATDPETGVQKPKRVTHIWVHNDTVTDLVVGGEVITTTEDHPFWSVTDQKFERADQLSAGEEILSADGAVITVSGLQLGTEREAVAYNLTVEGIHTYHVGDLEVLVHNMCAISVKLFGHTFNTHGAGSKNAGKLLGRARGTGNSQGQWMDNEAAASFLKSVNVPGAGPYSVRLPKGLGRVIHPDGSIVEAGAATIVPNGTGGIKTAYPIVGGSS